MNRKNRTSRLGVRAATRVVEPLEKRLLLAAHIAGNTTVFPTIQAAVDAAAPGAVINVDAGIYSELVTVDKPLTLRGAQAGVDARSNFRLGLAGETLITGATVSDGKTSAFYITASDVTIDGFNCQSNTSTSQYGAGIVIAPGVSGTHIFNNVLKGNVSGLFLANDSDTDPAIIQYNAFRSNNNLGSMGGRGIYSDQNVSGGSLTNVVIDSNFFLGNHGDYRTTTGLEAAIALESDGGVQSNIRITNNTFVENGKTLLAWNTNGLLIQGNVATDTLDSGSGTLRFEGGDSNVTITGNTIYDNMAPAVHIDTKAFGVDSSAFVITGNNMYGNGYDVHIGSLDVNAGTYDGPLDASNNWWGDPSGPGGDFAGAGDGAFVNGTAVKVAPWAAAPIGSLESSFAGPPSVPGPLVQAENFDQGGPGVGYNVAGALEPSGLYRATPAVIESTSDSGGGFDVYSLQAGQWLAYTLNVPQAGTYRLDVRAANSQTTPGLFNATLDNTDVTGPMTLSPTGGSQVWTAVSSSAFPMTAGPHVLRLLMDGNGSGGFVGSFNWLNLVFLASAPMPPTAPSGLAAMAISAAQINLNWTNTAANQTGFEIDRSTDGTNFAPLANVGATVSTYSDKGLTAGTQYYYRVEATNAAGPSPSSNIASATTLPLPPAAPSGLNASAVSTSEIDLNWTNTATNQTGFEIDRSPDGITFSPLASVDGTINVYPDTALTAGTKYYYRVEATNAGGPSPSSNIASATTQQTIPSAPTGLLANTVSNSQINLSWTNTASNQAGFEIDRSGDGATFTTLVNVGPAVNTYSDMGLTAATTYYYRVEATNSAGPSASSNIASATTLAAVLTAPTGLTASAVSTSQINLSWTNTATNQTGFEIDRSPDGITFAPLTNVGAAATTYSDINLAAGTKYYYRIEATNTLGSSPSSNIASATTAATLVTTYLSDLTWASATVGYGTIHKDASIAGTPIRLRGTTYQKGIGTHAVSQIVYNLNGQYQTFLSDVGLDDETAGQGAVDFRVLGDGKVLFDSGVVTGTSPAAHVNVSVTGVQQLTLLAINGIPTNNYWDHSDWAGARLLSIPVAPTAPTAPANLAATALSSSQIRLNWTNTANNQTGFEIDRSGDGVNFNFLANAAASATSYTDSGLSATTTYYYRVLATNAVGPSPSSNIASTVTPAIPTGPTYISDLNWTSATVGWGTIHKDASILGNPIRIGGSTYQKGIGTHANSTITYNLAGKYTSFLSDIGIDDEVGNIGLVYFQVIGDGKVLYTSGTITGATPVVHVSVNVTGVMQLQLLVITATPGDIHSDHSDWANARLT